MTGRERSIAIIFEGYPHVADVQRLLDEAYIETGGVLVEELISEELREDLGRLREPEPRVGVIQRWKNTLSGLRLMR